MTDKPLSWATCLLSLMIAAGMQSAALASDYPPPPGPYRSGPFVAPTQGGQGISESATREIAKGPGMLLPADTGGSDNIDEFAASNLFGAAPTPSATPETQALRAQPPLPDAAAARPPDTLPPQPFHLPAPPPDGYTRAPSGQAQGSDFSMEFSRRDQAAAPINAAPYRGEAAGYTGYSSGPVLRHVPESLSEYGPEYAPGYGPGFAPTYAPPSGYAEPGSPYPPTDMQDSYYPVFPDGYASDPYPLQGPAGSAYAPETGLPYHPASPRDTYPQSRFHGEPGVQNDAGYARQAYPDPAQWLDRQPPDPEGWQSSSDRAGPAAEQFRSRVPGGPTNQAAGGRLPYGADDQGLRFRPPDAAPD